MYGAPLSQFWIWRMKSLTESISLQNGLTFSEVPNTINISHIGKSYLIPGQFKLTRSGWQRTLGELWWYLFGRFSPKKVISGLIRSWHCVHFGTWLAKIVSAEDRGAKHQKFPFVRNITIEIISPLISAILYSFLQALLRQCAVTKVPCASTILSSGTPI